MRFNTCIEPLGGKDPNLVDFAVEKDGQMTVNIYKEIVVGKHENWIKIENAKIEPNGKRIQKTENQFSEGVLVCGRHNLLQKI